MLPLVNIHKPTPLSFRICKRNIDYYYSLKNSPRNSYNHLGYLREKSHYNGNSSLLYKINGSSFADCRTIRNNLKEEKESYNFCRAFKPVLRPKRVKNELICAIYNYLER